jgi:hypothetical protein
MPRERDAIFGAVPTLFAVPYLLIIDAAFGDIGTLP